MTTNNLSVADVAEAQALDAPFMAHWRKTNEILESHGLQEALYGQFRHAFAVCGLRNPHDIALRIERVRDEE